jgi:pimeloyl-ACP methyl ester carboxylesterase
MIDDEVAREALALLGTAPAMLVEDAHLQLTSPPRTSGAAHALAATLHRLGGDLAALGRGNGPDARRRSRFEPRLPGRLGCPVDEPVDQPIANRLPCQRLGILDMHRPRASAAITLHAQLQIVDGVNHMGFLQKADVYDAAIASFAASVQEKGSRTAA